MEKIITADNFEQEVLHSDVPVLVDFWATWCGPCMMLAPELEELSHEADDYVIGKVNVDENPALCEKFGISVIPTLLLFVNGEVIASTQGYLTKNQMKNFVDSAL